MSKESYTRGFFKAAKAAGVDPEKLMKLAQVSMKGPVLGARAGAVIGAGNDSQDEAIRRLRERFGLGKQGKKWPADMAEFPRPKPDPKAQEMMKKYDPSKTKRWYTPKVSPAEADDAAGVRPLWRPARTEGLRGWLNKSAQQYKTDGRAPKIISDFDRKNPGSYPYYVPPLYRNGKVTGRGSADPVGWNPLDGTLEMAMQAVSSAKFHSEDPVVAYLSKKYPQYENWYKAHTKSLSSALKAIEGTKSIPDGYGKDWERRVISDKDDLWGMRQRVRERLLNRYLSEVGGKAYHDSMHSLTGTPQRVSAPVKK